MTGSQQEHNQTHQNQTEPKATSDKDHKSTTHNNNNKPDQREQHSQTTHSPKPTSTRNTNRISHTTRTILIRTPTPMNTNMPGTVSTISLNATHLHNSTNIHMLQIPMKPTLRSLHQVSHINPIRHSSRQLQTIRQLRRIRTMTSHTNLNQVNQSRYIPNHPNTTITQRLQNINVRRNIIINMTSHTRSLTLNNTQLNRRYRYLINVTNRRHLIRTLHAIITNNLSRSTTINATTSATHQQTRPRISVPTHNRHARMNLQTTNSSLPQQTPNRLRRLIIHRRTSRVLHQRVRRLTQNHQPRHKNRQRRIVITRTLTMTVTFRMLTRHQPQPLIIRRHQQLTMRTRRIRRRPPITQKRRTPLLRRRPSNQPHLMLRTNTIITSHRTRHHKLNTSPRFHRRNQRRQMINQIRRSRTQISQPPPTNSLSFININITTRTTVTLRRRSLILSQGRPNTHRTHSTSPSSNSTRHHPIRQIH